MIFNSPLLLAAYCRPDCVSIKPCSMSVLPLRVTFFNFWFSIHRYCRQHIEDLIFTVLSCFYFSISTHHSLQLENVFMFIFWGSEVPLLSKWSSFFNGWFQKISIPYHWWCQHSPAHPSPPAPFLQKEGVREVILVRNHCKMLKDTLNLNLLTKLKYDIKMGWFQQLSNTTVVFSGYP